MVEAAGIAGQRSGPCASRAKLAREPASDSLQMILKAPRCLKPRLKPSPDFPPSFYQTTKVHRPARLLLSTHFHTEPIAVNGREHIPVSYTHLTLPTILRV